MGKARNVIMYDRYNKVIKSWDKVNDAVEETKIPYSTIFTQCKMLSRGRGDFYFRFGDTEPRKRKYNKAIVELNINDEYVKTYKNQKEVAKAKGVRVETINKYLHGIRKTNGFKLMYKDEYESIYGIIKERDNVDVNRPTSKEVYINILVGLANGTLIDGAIYNLNGTKLIYSKNENALKLDDKAIYTKDNMFVECSIELPLLLPKEKEFLSNLLKAFGNVNGIKKLKDRIDGFEFIRIETSNLEDSIVLPSYKEGKYYNGLKLDKLYTKEDLGI